MVIHGEGCWAILLSKPLLIPGLEDQQKEELLNLCTEALFNKLLLIG